MPAPVRVLIGPWNHTYPHNAVPGPAIEWRADAVRWWDHWLKGAENGIMSEPPVTVYVRHWHPPDVELAEIPGRWRRENALPPERAEFRTWFCGPEGRCRVTAEAPGAGRGCGTCRRPGSRRVTGGASSPATSGTRTRGASRSTPRRWTRTPRPGFPRVELCGSADAGRLHWFARAE